MADARSPAGRGILPLRDGSLACNMSMIASDNRAPSQPPITLQRTFHLRPRRVHSLHRGEAMAVYDCRVLLHQSYNERLPTRNG
jgi:hypothetical protein